MDRRRDSLFRDVVEHCRADLAHHGFSLTQRGSSPEHQWVRFDRPGAAAALQASTLRLLLAHSPEHSAFTVDAYEVDSLLGIPTPHAKLLQRYATDDAPAGVVHAAVHQLRAWAHGAVVATEEEVRSGCAVVCPVLSEICRDERDVAAPLALAG